MLLKFKDLFTLGTIISGFLVLVVASQGMIVVASYLIVFGFFLDILDGIVARITKTGNKFGAEFDRIADLVVYSFAPGFVLFFAFNEQLLFASLIGMLPVIFGCIRLARFNVKKIEYPGYWIGLPRPASALMIISIVNIFEQTSLFIMFGLVLVISIMNVLLIPFPEHRKLGTTGKIIVALFFCLILIFLFTPLFWEFAFVLGFLYIISPLFISKKDKKKIKKFTSAWKA